MASLAFFSFDFLSFSLFLETEEPSELEPELELESESSLPEELVNSPRSDFESL